MTDAKQENTGMVYHWLRGGRSLSTTVELSFVLDMFGRMLVSVVLLKLCHVPRIAETSVKMLYSRI